MPASDEALPSSLVFGGGVLLLSLSVVIVYWPAVDGPFIFDDAVAIVDNPSIRQLWPLVGSEDEPGPLNPPEESPLATRPLVNFSFALNYYVGELKPQGYRFVNIVLHCLTATLLWRIAAGALRSDVFGDRVRKAAELLAFATALLWAVHPLVTESVVYVTQRTELLMGLFYLVTLYCSTRYWSATKPLSRKVWLVAASASCVLGMLSKEMIASVPAMVLLYERTFFTGTFRRALARSWRLYLGLTLTWLVAILLHLDGSQTPNAGFGIGVPVTHWWLTQAQIFFLYLKLASWPWPLVIHYEIPYLTTLTQAWPWVLGVLAYAIVTLVFVWRHPPIGFALTWVVAVLSPTLVIPLVGETAAERRMYVPLTALIALLVVGGYWTIGRLQENSSRLQAAWYLTCAFALAMGLGWLSSQRLLAYQDKVTLWRNALKHQPHDPVVHANLGCNLAEEGQLLEAITHLQEWVRLKPDSHRSHFNLALSLERSKQNREAMKHYQKSLELHPEQAATHYNLARLLEQRGDWSRAITHYLKAIEARTNFSAAHTNLGLLLLEMGKLNQAVEHLEAAIDDDASRNGEVRISTAPYENLMFAYLQAGRREEAIRTAQRATDIARSQDDEKTAEQFETDIATIREMNE